MTIEDGLKDKENIPIVPLGLNGLKHIKWHWWEYPEIWCRRLWTFIEDIPREIKWFIQRGKRGYSDRDVWGFDYYLANVIYHGLLHLKKYKHGFPSTFNPDTSEWSFDEKRWDSILNRMIAGWKLAYECTTGDLEYALGMSDSDKAKIQKNMQEAYPEFRYLSNEEESVMKEGFYLFSKYFFNLWD